MASPRSSRWRLVAGVLPLLLAGLLVRHASRIDFFAADDLLWRSTARSGLGVVAMGPSVLRHFRPTFGVWLWGLVETGLDGPRASVAASSVLLVLVFLLATRVAGRWLSPVGAVVAAVLFLCHPLLHELWFWGSGQIDLLCLVFSLSCLFIALGGSSRKVAGFRWALVALSACLAGLAKETAFGLPALVWMLDRGRPTPERLRRSGAAAFGILVAAGLAVGVVGAGSHWLSTLWTWHPWSWLAYPSRLVFPSSLFEARAAWREGDWAALWPEAAATAAAVACAGVAWWWAKHERAVRVGLGLAAFGWLVWAVDPSERSVGLGVFGAAMLLGFGVERVRPSAAVAALVALSVAWGGLWLQREADWESAKAVGGRMAMAMGRWRHDNPHGLLVGVGTPWSVGPGAFVSHPVERDPCVALRLQLEGRRPMTLGLVREEGGRIRVRARDDSKLYSAPSKEGWRLLPGRRGTTFAEASVELAAAEAGYVRRAGCGEPDFRLWDGEEFVAF